MNDLVIPAKLKVLFDAMAAMPQTEIDTIHNVNNGMYARTVFIPAGMLVAGATHLTDHFTIFAGDASLVMDGETAQRLTGFHVFNGAKGLTRAVYAHTDCWMTVVFRTDKTNLVDIENDLIANPEFLQTRNPAMSVNKQVLLGV